MIITEKILWDFIEGRLNDEKRDEILTAIKLDDNLNARIEKLRVVHDVVYSDIRANSELLSSDFAERVLQKIESDMAEPRVRSKDFQMLLIYIFSPLFIILTYYYVLAMKHNPFATLHIDKTTAITVAILIAASVIIMTSFVLVRYFYYRNNWLLH